MVPAPPVTISVVIPACNRPDDVRRCLESLTAVRYPNWDVLVVDQSDSTSTKDVVERFVSRLPRLRYLALDSKGASQSRNAGVEATTGEWVAFLDDDCTVAPTWLEDIAGICSLHPQAALIFGRVIAPTTDWNQQWVPTADLKRERIWHGRLSTLRIKGIGAGMYVRRSVFNAVGPFDVFLGPGSGFAPAGEEEDLCYRCLARGYQVVEAPSIVVVHFGARDYATGAVSSILTGYAFAGGILTMKLLRTGDIVALAFLGGRLWQYCLWVNWRKVVLMRRASGLKRLAMYIRGLKASFAHEVDHHRSLYRSRER